MEGERKRGRERSEGRGRRWRVDKAGRESGDEGETGRREKERMSERGETGEGERKERWWT